MRAVLDEFSDDQGGQQLDGKWPLLGPEPGAVFRGEPAGGRHRSDNEEGLRGGEDDGVGDSEPHVGAQISMGSRPLRVQGEESLEQRDEEVGEQDHLRGDGIRRHPGIHPENRSADRGGDREGEGPAGHEPFELRTHAASVALRRPPTAQECGAAGLARSRSSSVPKITANPSTLTPISITVFRSPSPSAR